MTGAPAGSTVIVAFSSGGAIPGGPIASCQDTRGNSYSVDVNLAATSSNRGLAICSAINIVTALGAADTITVSFPSNGNGQHATANVFTGVLSRDQTQSGSGTSNAPSS